jgi:hypothetical protein
VWWAIERDAAAKVEEQNRESEAEERLRWEKELEKMVPAGGSGLKADFPSLP